VRRIFAEFICRDGFYAIAEGLTRDGIPSPSAHDPGRNRHGCGIAWNTFAVRAILINPRYTGHQVWSKQRKDEVLIDVDDVALGHTTKLRWNETDDWIWSEKIVHPPIIDREIFDQVQMLVSGRASKPARHKPHRAQHPYALRGCVWCGIWRISSLTSPGCSSRCPRVRVSCVRWSRSRRWDGNWNDGQHGFEPIEVCGVGGEQGKPVRGGDARDHQVSHASPRLAAHADHLGGDDPVLPGGFHVERQRAEGCFHSLNAHDPPGALNGTLGRMYPCRQLGEADRADEELSGQLVDCQPLQVDKDVSVAEPSQVAGGHSPSPGSRTRS
jgi:recombinase